MDSKNDIKRIYFSITEKMISKFNPDKIELFRKLWKDNKLREAYVLVEGLPKDGWNMSSYENADKDFYWTYIY